ncbi:hypothetical protein OE88DRAFT_1797176 [Heliocybe sulcata]|uniref:Uncharacterized protein n=1 Tax=Heliocybe sulcata TaxID=5364 RepID=A0A5C3MIL5_9AGAM|nr:hypothetical protein OE88DRAFT_1797176 [Heliocybe sulcata]
MASTSLSLKHVQKQRIQVPETMSVTLTEEEDQICALLDEYTKRVKEKDGVSTSCRVAGGWVRDKVNRQCYVRLSYQL